MELKITTLIENQPDNRGELLCEHGLSLYIEFQGKKLLFDTGQTGAFLNNAGKSDKSIEEVDYIIISHGHYDHSGGVPQMLDYLNTKVQDKKVSPDFYVGKEFFAPKYKKLSDGSYHYNGNPFSEETLLQASVNLKKIEQDITYITEDIILFKNFAKKNHYEQTNPKFYVKIGTGAEDLFRQDEIYVPDEFVDEIALGFVTTKGLVLVVGCSHAGIINILEAATERIGLPVYAVLGGTHLVEAGEERIEKTMEAFSAFRVQRVAVSHCTGEAGIAAIRNKFPEGFVINNTGNIFQI